MDELDAYFALLAEKTGVDEGEAVKRALAFYFWYLELREQGGTLYVRLPDGTLTEPIFNLRSPNSPESQGTL
jgi:hypothetical protein